MKKAPMILLLIAPYAIVVVCSQLELDLVIGICGYAGLILFNMVYAFRLPGLGFNGKQILRWNLLLKLCNIPLEALIAVFAWRAVKSISGFWAFWRLPPIWSSCPPPCSASAVCGGTAKRECCPRGLRRWPWPRSLCPAWISSARSFAALCLAGRKRMRIKKQTRQLKRRKTSLPHMGQGGFWSRMQSSITIR